MIKKSLISVAIILATTSLLCEEISVFDAGNLNSSNPYGLTQNEQVLLSNKNKVEKLNQNFGSTEAKLNNAIESIEGLQSIIEGNNAQIARMEQRLSMLEIGGASVANGDSDLRKYVEESRAIQEKNNKEIKKVLAELSTLIDSINSNYVSKSDLSKMNLKDTPKDSASNSKKKEAQAKVETSSNSDFSQKSSADILKEASDMYKSKNYSAAKERYQHLVNLNYKPAEATFMLGEIEYFSKSYASAIENYQKSISIYDKASYTPKLLYHTAISFDKVGDKASANKFYKFLKTTYPDSQEAKASPNR